MSAESAVEKLEAAIAKTGHYIHAEVADALVALRKELGISKPEPKEEPVEEPATVKTTVSGMTAIPGKPNP